MKALSQQLTDLAARSKKTEDVVAAAQEKNRARLESQRDKLKTSIADGSAKARERAASAEGKTQQWWSDTRSSADARFATVRAEAAERRTEKDIKKAERHAEQAEQDAADAIDWALYVLDQAEYAAIDAVIARADAEALANTDADLWIG
jgi:DNA-directed RNA polymerase alpha subunit